MQKQTLFIFLVLMLLISMPLSAHARVVETKWGGDAEIVYDTGFMHMLMKHPDGGVCLFNRDLIQNDAPGAGMSDKGVSSDIIWGQHRARKVVNIEDNRAHNAFLVILIKKYSTALGKHPVHFSVNGNDEVVWDLSKYKSWRCYWTEFPVEWLNKERNVIELSCPDATTPEDGWELVLARADEFEHGGGDPTDVGKTSFKSFNGGKTWKESPFGPDSKTRAEYTIRISLDRYVGKGWLSTSVIDLWRGDSKDFIIPTRTFSKMVQTKNRLTLSFVSDLPEGTTVNYFMRVGLKPGPYDDEWESYEYIGSGSELVYEVDDTLNRRYIQFKAELTTENPLVSPVVKSVEVRTKLSEFMPVPDNIKVISVENPEIQYSSINWKWEPWDRPEFEEIRLRENLDELVSGCRTEFEAQVKLMDYVIKRFNWIHPDYDYPGWDAKSILERIDRVGSGGMCIQFNNLLAGMCMAYGWQARLVNIYAHEICEVWNDEFGKWIYLDSSYTNFYSYDKETLTPQNYLEIHNHYTKMFQSEKPYDWMYDGNLVSSDAWDKIDNFPLGQGSPTFHALRPWAGVNLAQFMRMVPRNNFYEQPYPMPLAHGIDKWPWDGYINWYDEKTPPNRKHSWFTDRPRDMWPDLNKVHIHALSSYGNDRLFLHFETYTPNFSHFEVSADDTEWKKTGEKWTWFLRSGKNTLRVRSVNKLGVKGKPSSVVLHYVDELLKEYEKIN